MFYIHGTMEIFRMMAFIFQNLGKLVNNLVHLVMRLFFGGEKTQLDEDHEIKEIFGEEVSGGGEMEQGDKIYYKAMMNAIKRALSNLDDSFLKIVDNMKDEDFDQLLQQLNSEVKSENTHVLFDRVRGDFTEEGKSFIEKRLFNSLVPENTRGKLIEDEDFVEPEIDKEITSDEYFRETDFLLFLKNEYGLSDTVASKSLTYEDFEKIKLLYDEYKLNEDEDKDDIKKEKDKDSIEDNIKHVFKESDELNSFIRNEYGISYSIYKTLKEEELEIINKKYVNLLKGNRAFPDRPDIG